MELDIKTVRELQRRLQVQAFDSEGRGDLIPKFLMWLEKQLPHPESGEIWELSNGGKYFLWMDTWLPVENSAPSFERHQEALYPVRLVWGEKTVEVKEDEASLDDFPLAW